MLTRAKCWLCIAVGMSVGLVALALAARAEAPRGWFLAESKPAEYLVNIDPDAVREGHVSVRLQDRNGNKEGFGTLMQQIRAEQYLGKRLRFAGFVKSEEVKDWAGLWMRVDQGTTVVSFDNMQSRPIRGTGDWQQYSVVLDVPKDATGIAFGVLLTGSGRVWLNNTKFEVVGVEVPTTGSMDRPAAPVNLDFSAN
jgi:hypothetical protein